MLWNPGFLINHIMKRRQRPAVSDRPGKYFERCILHIGAEKTGTSTIQSFLTINREAFAREGIYYPAVTGKNGGSQWGFVVCAHSNPWNSDVGKLHHIYTEEDQSRFREELRKSLLEEFEGANQTKVLIISSEHFHSRLTNKEMIAKLRAFLEPWVKNFEIILYLRRQDRAAVSFYSTAIKSGDSNPAPFPISPQGNVPYYYNYEHIHDNWSAVFGQDNVHTRLFSPREWRRDDLIADFCSACGISYEGKRLPEMENRSLDIKGAQFLMEVNRQLPNFIDGQKNKERQELVQLVSKLCVGRVHPLIRKEAKNFYRQFIECNERLRQKAFPNRSEPLFDDDFSDYSEEAEPVYEEAVELAIWIWRASKNYQNRSAQGGGLVRNMLARIRGK